MSSGSSTISLTVVFHFDCCPFDNEWYISDSNGLVQERKRYSSAAAYEYNEDTFDLTLIDGEEYTFTM